MSLFRRRPSATPESVVAPGVPAQPESSARPEPTPEQRAEWQKIVEKPVTNPDLVQALAAFGQDPSDANLLPMLHLLRHATLLGAIHVQHAPGSTPGTLAVGTLITQYVLISGENTRHLALFTDHDALRAHLGENSGWSGMVLPPDHVWPMARQHAGGAVLNVSGPVRLELTPDKIERMFALTGGQ